MSGNEARYIEESDFRDAAVTTRTTVNRDAPRPHSYPQFWTEFYSRPDRKIEDEIKPQLEEFQRYPVGWDSYKGVPLRTDIGNFALTILTNILKPQTPLPQVIPTSSGGVQFEWHERDIDLELHFNGPYECQVWFYDHRDPDVPAKSEKLVDDVSMLKHPIELLTSRD
jgi:hypothetical protein